MRKNADRIPENLMEGRQNVYNYLSIKFLVSTKFRDWVCKYTRRYVA
jgi:hypothetical protein